ncbi:MAG: hypothetical protein HGA47_00105 [Zoogloea sp.]|nr:hypothetical protein [Zoogloea sp.]
MKTHAFEAARQAFASLELFADQYASSQPFQEHFQSVTGVLRGRAENLKGASPHEAAFYATLADALEKLNGKL